MVRRRSTVRFRKGAPQVRRVFRLPNRGPLPVQGEGPEFYPEAKAQVRASVSLPRRYGTVPVWRKISAIASLTGCFALACARPPFSVQCRWGANGGARSLSGGPDVVAPPGRLALWSYLTGQVVSSPGGARGWVGGATGSASTHSTRGARYLVDSCGPARRSVTCWTRCPRWQEMCSADAVTSTKNSAAATTVTTTNITCTFNDQAAVGLPVSSRGLNADQRREPSESGRPAQQGRRHGQQPRPRRVVLAGLCDRLQMWLPMTERS
jgi:hypothetical protein